MVVIDNIAVAMTRLAVVFGTFIRMVVLASVCRTGGGTCMLNDSAQEVGTCAHCNKHSTEEHTWNVCCSPGCLQCSPACHPGIPRPSCGIFTSVSVVVLIGISIFKGGAYTPVL